MPSFSSIYGAAKGYGMAAYRNPMIRNAAIGGLAGGIIGSATNDSFWGGAAIGAGLGGYGTRLMGLPGMRSAWNTGAGKGLMGAFAGSARFAGQQLMRDGRVSAGFLRNNVSRAYNAIRGMF